MSIMPLPRAAPRVATGVSLSRTTARALFVVLIGAAVVAGFVATDAGNARDAAAEAGADLTRLLRLMMLIKAALAALAVAATLWRLRWPVSSVRFAAYAVAGAAMAAGPGLIWGMAHVGLGALLLHAGLGATVVLLWRDPSV